MNSLGTIRNDRRPPNGSACFIGLDIGAETIKKVKLRPDNGCLSVVHREILEHEKKPGQALCAKLSAWNWAEVAGAAVTGRFSVQVKLSSIPAKQAQLRGFRFLFDDEPVTIVNIGSHGFSVLELRAKGQTVFRENSRCSQGTGNFLRQLVERFSLTVEEAGVLCAEVRDPAPLSGRCPVILKTDMTHLANKGEDRARVLAGLFDAICENVLVLLKPGVSPARVLLTGGVSRSPRIRRVFGELLAKQGMTLMAADEDRSLYLEAVGCALIASENPARPPGQDELLLPPGELKLERLPALAESLGRVRRMPKLPWARVNGVLRRLVFGFDIGSTGSKALALDLGTREVVWEAYRETLGDPVGSAQDLLRRFTDQPAAKYPVVAFGATGSGREVVGSLLASCYGHDAVLVVNEIVAHATGALHFDPSVDTIFEIGGQDSKYTRLEEGRIIDCAMNEACSAGTGSFIEEQGRKFAGVADIRGLADVAMAAPAGVSLGQHCSVFMAEVIDEAVAAGIQPTTIVSGLYDSIIENYLNRVKGNRSIGKVIFCQGMPFSADALAAAVARQTGSKVVVPPNPGTVGALGIALLAARELDAGALAPLDVNRFLNTKVEEKDTFICGSSRGCGGAGNHCRIERLRTRVEGRRASFTWGGGCALYDKGARKRKLPDLSPDPFRERDELLKQLVMPLAGLRGNPRIALSDEFMLKGLLPFFAAFFHQAGFDLEILSGAGYDTLKRGIQLANVPFCAPMQLYHGVALRLAGTGADWAFVPMLRAIPRPNGQRCSVTCPIVQAAPDMIRWIISGRHHGASTSHPRILSPLIEFKESDAASEAFLPACRQLAAELRLSEDRWRAAWNAGCALQREFETASREIGRRALAVCRERDIPPVVVLGRSYTIYNPVLNSNVPSILREQGAIGIPADCFPLAAETPTFPDMYWGYGQNLMRVAHQVRRMPGVYALYCSNYSCGPDSFNLHFAAYAMAGKPFAVIETDGHSGDAGTKTRIEAFLHCVREHQRTPDSGAVLHNFASTQFSGLRAADLGAPNGTKEKLLVPYMGQSSEVVAAVFRGLGVDAEALPAPGEESKRLGRRYTSGKECLPMPLTLGSLLHRLTRARNGERFAYLMPSTDGPCRFGVYNLLNNIVLEELGWRERVRIWSPKDTGYFDGLPGGSETLLFAGIVASDVLRQATLDVRPVERQAGAAERLHEEFTRQLLTLVETVARGPLSLAPTLWQVACAHLFGIPELLAFAGHEFAATRGPGELPVVELTGEIYLRGVDFANDSIIKNLEARGLRVHLAPTVEWINYCNFLQREATGRNRLADRLSARVQNQIEKVLFGAIAPSLGWSEPPTTAEALTAAKPYINPAVHGEAVLTVGVPLQKWRRGQIDAVLTVAPLECMPAKIAEAQYHHVSEREGILSLTLGFTGDPLNRAVLDNFAFEVKARFAERQRRGTQFPRNKDKGSAYEARVCQYHAGTAEV